MAPLVVTSVIVTVVSLVTAHANIRLPIVMGVVVALVIGLLLIPCHYTLTDDAILIRCGLLRQRIALKDVRAIELSDCPLSAPALSLRRIRIETMNGREQLISPRDREGFIAEVRAKITPA